MKRKLSHNSQDMNWNSQIQESMRSRLGQILDINEQEGVELCDRELMDKLENKRPSISPI